MALNLAEKRIVAGVVAVLAIIAVNSSAFVVDESEYTVVLRFGRVVAEIDEPGLNFKLPYPIDVLTRNANEIVVAGDLEEGEVIALENPESNSRSEG